MRSHEAWPVSHHESLTEEMLSFTRSAVTIHVLTFSARLPVIAKFGLRLWGAVGSMRPPPLSTRKPAPQRIVRRLRLAWLCVPSRATSLMTGASSTPAGPRSPTGPAEPAPPFGPVGPVGPCGPLRPRNPSGPAGPAGPGGALFGAPTFHDRRG